MEIPCNNPKRGKADKFIASILTFLLSKAGIRGTFIFPSQKILESYYDNVCKRLYEAEIDYVAFYKENTIQVGETKAVFTVREMNINGFEGNAR